MTTFVYLLMEQANDMTGPQERLMSFCNNYRRSAQEKLEISVIAQAVGDLKNRTSPGIPIQERSNSDWNRYKEL